MKSKKNNLNKKLTMVFNQLNKKPQLIVLIVLAFVGTVMVVASRASTFSIQIQPELGVVAGCAEVIKDSLASDSSGNNTVRFGTGSNCTVTPPPLPTDGVFSILAIPDTQPEINSVSGEPRFTNRMNWIVQNKTSMNVKHVIHTGDLQDWDTPNHDQYQRASTSLKILDQANVPYTLTVGNHDTAAVAVGGSAKPGESAHVNVRNTSTWNSFYPVSRFKLDGVYEAGKTDNAYRTFTAGGLNWLVINLELWPRTGAINWAKTVVANHPKHNVIISTHSYLTSSGTIQQDNGGYGDNSPQYMFDNLIKQYPNIKMVFSGHVGNGLSRQDTGIGGNKIYSFLTTYHSGDSNPTRILTIDTVNKSIKSRVYGPWNNKTFTDGNADLSGVSFVQP